MRGAARPVINPSGGPLCGHPIMMTGGIRLGEAFRQLAGRAAGTRVAGAATRHRARHARALPAAQPGLGRGQRAEVVMKRPVAVVGVGQTHHTSRRSDVSIPGLVREAVDRALLDAGLEHKDIDAVIVGKAPDMLEGVAQPEQFLAGALGAHLKPLLRVHTAGSVGASTALTAVTHVASGLYERVLTVAFEKQSEGNAMWALSPNMPFTRAAGRRRRRLLRTVLPRLHHQDQVPATHRADHRGQRARQRRAQRVRPPARADDARGRDELADAVGSDPFRRDLPVLRRRHRDGPLVRGAGEERARTSRRG